ncbi:hypothetical protein BDZ85DRAFT_108947 [Elsinoe ampelina]|uniref:Uncharacterized protein n=1 Tax=Elsinoe ampelina TaxID=302913 RepID=A0A6A6GCT3_9PEZI|nr:hypothetical protein BDZ85DRAFT_108947 [Elsinoe ampelina]
MVLRLIGKCRHRTLCREGSVDILCPVGWESRDHAGVPVLLLGCIDVVLFQSIVLECVENLALPHSGSDSDLVFLLLGLCHALLPHPVVFGAILDALLTFLRCLTFHSSLLTSFVLLLANWSVTAD